MFSLAQPHCSGLRRLAALAVALLGTTALPPAHAAVQLPTADQGHIRLESFLSITQVQHFEFDTSMKLQSLSCCGGAGNAFAGDRAYAFFAIPDLIDLGAGAKLNFMLSPTTPALPSSLALHEIFSPLAPFQVSHAGADATGIGLFTDLGNGPVYASTGVSAGGSFSLALAPEALARIDAMRGGFFGVGVVAEIASVANPLVLSQMTLEVSAVPEPGAAWLLLLGLLLPLVGRARQGFTYRWVKRSDSPIAK